MPSKGQSKTQESTRYAVSFLTPSSISSAWPPKSVAVTQAMKGIGLLGSHVKDMIAGKKTETIMMAPDICSIVAETAEDSTKAKVRITV